MEKESNFQGKLEDKTPPPEGGLGGLEGFWHGARSFFRGVEFLLRHPRLLPLLVAPLLLTAALYLLLAYLALRYFSGWYEAFFAEKTAWYWTWTGVKLFAWLIFFLVAGALSFFTFVTAGSAINAPFNDRLSHEVEKILIPDLMPPAPGWIGLVREVLRNLAHELAWGGLYLSALVGLLPLNFLPGAGQLLYGGLMAYLSSRTLAWYGLGYSLSRRGLSFSQKSAFLKRHRLPALGFGAAAFLLLLIPLATLFVLPLAAVGGTLLFCDLVKTAKDGPAFSPKS